MHSLKQLLSRPALVSGHAVAGLVTSILVIAIGLLLFAGKRDGLRLSMGLQVAQVVNFTAGPITYRFLIGPSVVASIEGSTVFFTPIVDSIIWFGLAAPGRLWWIQVNLLAVFLLFCLRRSGSRQGAGSQKARGMGS